MYPVLWIFDYVFQFMVVTDTANHFRTFLESKNQQCIQHQRCVSPFPKVVLSI